MGGVQTTRFINQNNLLQFSIIGWFHWNIHFLKI
jgi:hypothetical protein